jgi:RNA polymerase sigma-70 factor (ECF subfamily)
MTAIEFNYKLTSLHGGLMRFAYRLTADNDDAKDLVQDTILKALINSDKFVSQSNFKAWTYTIMRNTFINNYRQRKLRATYHVQDIESSSDNGIISSCSDDPDSTYLAKEIAQNIEQLNDMFRIPFEMHLFGYKYKEIANELNLNIGTVKSRIFLSRKQLMRQLNR